LFFLLLDSVSCVHSAVSYLYVVVGFNVPLNIVDHWETLFPASN